MVRSVSLAGCRAGCPEPRRACLPSSIVGFFHGAFQPHLDQMQHAPISNPARCRSGESDGTVLLTR